MTSCSAAGSTAPTTPTRAHDRNRAYAVVGGPLDGLLLDITDWTADEIQTGVSLLTELGQFGVDGRALYDSRPGARGCWDWSGDSPDRRPRRAARKTPWAR